ncbi:MAG: universal stress protein [Gemmatimonadota bacterium]
MKDPLLVATDGSSEATAALQFAAAYAASEGVPVEVVSVAAPLSDLPMPLPHRDELEHAHAQGVAAAVRARLREIVGPVGWPIHVCLGRPAPAICSLARRRSARMVVLGVAAGRAQESTVAVEMLHLADRPVLVARSGRLPRRVLVGVDFRPSSHRAAALALRLLRPGGEAHLVHVRPSLDFPAAAVWDWGRCYDCAVEGGFRELIGRLEREDIRVTAEILAGAPDDVLVSTAEEREADLLAIGSDGYICNDRVVLGQVARSILSRPTVPVLATPVTTLMDGGPEELTASGTVVSHGPS